MLELDSCGITAKILTSLPNFFKLEGVLSTKYTTTYGILYNIYEEFINGEYDKVLFDIPKIDLPLYINNKDPKTRSLVKWRLYNSI
jgi:hypothetical protein